MQLAPIPSWLTIALSSAAAVAAVWRGGREERAVAVIVAAQILNAYFLLWPRLGGFTTDIITFGLCLGLLFRADRYWLVWAAASGLLSLVTDVLNIYPGLSRWAYLSAQHVWFYVLIGSVLFGSLTRDVGPAPARAGSGR